MRRPKINEPLREAFVKLQQTEWLTGSPAGISFALQSCEPMNDLNRALGDISSIRKQVARSTEFRGYGPATLAATGLIAVVATMVQGRVVVDPVQHLGRYLWVWIGTAVLGAAFAGVQMYTRTRRMHSGMSDEMIRMAVEQFVPAFAAGLLFTVVLVRFAPAVCWMLPGVWQIVFSLGVFASCRFLPKQMWMAGVWYLLTGLVCVSLGDGRALAPWAMGVPYGVGQMLVAGVLLTSAEEVRDED